MPAPWWAAAILALAWLMIPALTEAGTEARTGGAAATDTVTSGSGETPRP